MSAPTIGTVLSAPQDRSLRRARHELLGAGGAIMAIGAFTLWRSFSVRQPRGYTVVGPRVVPIGVAGGLIVLGLAFLVHVALGRETTLEQQLVADKATASPRTPALLVAALIVYSATLRPVGYVIATAMLLPVAAFLLGSRRPLRDGVVGVVLAVAVYLAFHRVLGIQLPSGVLGDSL